MDIEKTFDNEDENLEESIPEWLNQWMLDRFDKLMEENKSPWAEVYLTDVDEENQTVGFMWVLN